MNKNFEAELFLPPYTPQYAQVENFFSVLKNNFWSKMKWNYQSSQSNTAIKAIDMTIKNIGREKFVRMWDHNFQWIQEDTDCLFKLSKWIIRINSISSVLYISIWAIITKSYLKKNLKKIYFEIIIYIKIFLIKFC